MDASVRAKNRAVQNHIVVSAVVPFFRGVRVTVTGAFFIKSRSTSSSRKIFDGSCRHFPILCILRVYRDTEETKGRMDVEGKRQRDARFVEAIRQNRAGMFCVARMMLRSDSDAEEAVADATERAYAHLYALRNWQSIRP